MTKELIDVRRSIREIIDSETGDIIPSNFDLLNKLRKEFPTELSVAKNALAEIGLRKLLNEDVARRSYIPNSRQNSFLDDFPTPKIVSVFGNGKKHHRAKFQKMTLNTLIRELSRPAMSKRQKDRALLLEHLVELKKRRGVGDITYEEAVQEG